MTSLCRTSFSSVTLWPPGSTPRMTWETCFIKWVNASWLVFVIARFSTCLLQAPHTLWWSFYQTFEIWFIQCGWFLSLRSVARVCNVDIITLAAIFNRNFHTEVTAQVRIQHHWYKAFSAVLYVADLTYFPYCNCYEYHSINNKMNYARTFQLCHFQVIRKQL